MPSYILSNSYRHQENAFVQFIRVHKSDVPRNANVIRSHVLYKIKTRDDASLTCKARIAPHGNEDRDREHLRTDSACCPPLGIPILFSISVMFQCYLTKIDVKSAFLQTGSAQRDVYVIPPKESADRGFVWLLTVATYGLVNANAKWQVHSDQTFIDMGLNTLVYVTQFFYMHENGELVLMVVKVTDDIFIAGSEVHKRKFIHKLKQTYELGTITHLPGSCWFFGLQVSQDSDYVIRVDADQKLFGISSYNANRTRRRQSNEKLNKMEKFHYNSINGSVGFIGVHALTIASFVSSYLQQTRNYATVHDLSKKSGLLKKLKQLGILATMRYLEVRIIIVWSYSLMQPVQLRMVSSICSVEFCLVK